MRKISYGAAVAALLGVALNATPAFAQKNGENLSDNMTYIEDPGPREQEPQPLPERQSSVETDQSAFVSDVEPAGGDQNTGEDFTGFYAGADVGFGIGSAEVSGGGPSGDAGLDGWNGGVFAGYGYTTESDWIGGYIGLEGGYTWNSMDGDVDGVTFEKGNSWHATLRPGVVMNDDTLGYLIAGYSRANFEAGASDEDLDGLILGAGAEFDSETPLKLRLEYQYTTYKDDEIGGIDVEPQDNVLKVGAVYRL